MKGRKQFREKYEITKVLATIPLTSNVSSTPPMAAGSSAKEVSKRSSRANLSTAAGFILLSQLQARLAREK